MGRGLFTPIFVCVPPPQNCAQLIQTIEDTGTIQREIRDLEEQVGGLGKWGGGGQDRIQIGMGGDLRTPPPSPKCFWGSFPTDVSLHPFLCLPPQIFALRVPKLFGGFSPLNSVCVPQFHGPPPPNFSPTPPSFFVPPSP